MIVCAYYYTKYGFIIPSYTCYCPDMVYLVLYQFPTLFLFVLDKSLIKLFD